MGKDKRHLFSMGLLATVYHGIDEQVKRVANNKLATRFSRYMFSVVIPANKWFYCILFLTTTSNRLMLDIGMSEVSNLFVIAITTGYSLVSFASCTMSMLVLVVMSVSVVVLLLL